MKYLHVDGDDGSICVLDTVDMDWYGWVYKVPDNYKLVLSLKDLAKGPAYIYGTFESKGLELVKRH